MGQEGTASYNSQEALRCLVEGNERFLQGRSLHPHEEPQWRNSLGSGQEPFAIILGCSDSRVPPELIFDQGFGDLFVIRVAGNVIDSDVAGSVEYGVIHLQVPLVVVLGHEGCGAVTAALMSKSERGEEASEIQGLLARIQPALPEIDRSKREDEIIKDAVEANVKWSMNQLGEIPVIYQRIEKGLLTIVGGVYEIVTGRVNFIEEQ
ncbi:MAG: carbonic anhydrase [Planctomycetota bacterium]|jgi:carbonic anhydrase